MKALIFCILALGSSGFADDDLTETTTCQTNAQRIVTFDVYKRFGATNLTIKTITRKDDSKKVRIQNVYRNEKLVMEIWDMGDGLTFSVKPQSDCSVGTHFNLEGALVNASLMDANLMTLDHFVVTNGLLTPVSSVEIQKSNRIATDISALLAPENLRKSTPGEISAQAVDLMMKNGK